MFQQRRRCWPSRRRGHLVLSSYCFPLRCRCTGAMMLLRIGRRAQADAHCASSLRQNGNTHDHYYVLSDPSSHSRKHGQRRSFWYPCSKLASADRVVGDRKIVSQCAAATSPDHIQVPISTTDTPPMITLQTRTLEEGAVH